MKINKQEVYSNKNIIMEGVFQLQPQIFSDERGYFYETYNQNDFATIGITESFVQDNISTSNKDVLRGMHFQKKFCQGKLVQCLKGSIMDCIIDLRNSSRTFGQYAEIFLDEKNKNSLYVPKGFAHGYLVLSNTATIYYKCTNFYHPEEESGIIWNDKTVNIDWPIKKESIILKERDVNFPDFDFYKSYFDINGNWIGE